MSQSYNPKEIEKKWQKVWEDEKAFQATNDFSKPKYSHIHPDRDFM